MRRIPINNKIAQRNIFLPLQALKATVRSLPGVVALAVDK